ncbi:hypothetical protein WDV06_31335 [Streptomyces racemochromogenes]|uniref:Uncharacterized protein n=1 Tax=Streptomyces racemochromogenes TaxID=67353 RepID=A0ABW7PMB4_9ACTN
MDGGVSGELAAYLCEAVYGSRVVITPAVCEGCGGREFLVLAGDRGVERECSACCGRAFLADREDVRTEGFWDDGSGWAVCPCGGGEFEAALAFSFDGAGSVRSVTAGLRCVEDGTCGICAGPRGPAEAGRSKLGSLRPSGGESGGQAGGRRGGWEP